MKMWTSFCSGRLVWGIILAAAMLIPSSEVVAAETYVPVISLSCCPKVSPSRIQGEIESCFEQKPRVDCNLHAFRIKIKGREWCVSPAARWLRQMIKQKKVLCTPELS